MEKSRKRKNLYIIFAIILPLSMTLMALSDQKEISIQHYAENSEYGKGLKSSASVSELWKFPSYLEYFSSPALGDIDNDGKLEVIISSHMQGHVEALDSENGHSIWKFYYMDARPLGTEFACSPTLGDIDDDGKLEVVVADKDWNLFALNGESGLELWAATVPGVVDGSAVLGDLDDDGKLEVVIGCNDGYLYAFNGEDGSLLWGYYIGTDTVSSPVLSDVDGDGKLEVVIGGDDAKIYLSHILLHPHSLSLPRAYYHHLHPLKPEMISQLLLS